MPKMSMGRVVLGVMLVVMLGAAPAFAQSTVTVSGVVTDGSGAVVVGATVDAVVAERPVSRATTDADGRYRVQVPSGVRSQLLVRALGFADFVADMSATTGATTRDVALQVGGVSDTVVVTASRGAESRSRVTQSVSVMTAADIQALGSTSLAEVVRFVPGLAIEGTGREGALTSLFSRGGESDYNLVLVDGVRVNLDGGQFDFSRIAGAEIDRVEVVRGGQSSLWGSDAIGSVVQVFTKRAGVSDAPRITGSLEGGSFNTFRGDTQLTGGALRRVDYQASVTYRKTDGAFGDILPEDDRFEQTAFDGGMGGKLGDNASLRTVLRYSNGQGRSVGPITYGSRDTGGIYDTKDVSWTVASDHAAGRFTGAASVNYFYYRNRSSDTIADPAYSTFTILTGTPNALYPNGTQLVRLIDATEFASLVAAGALPAPGQFLASRVSNDSPFTSSRELRRPAFRYQGDVVWAGNQRFSAGYEWERERNPLVDEQDLHNNAFFVQQQFSVNDRWFVTVGARSDSKQSYDTFFSPKLSAGGFLLPFQQGAVSSLRVFGNIGKGIKSPTFSERFGGSFADPAPDLKVEKARTGDIGLEATFADQRFRAGITYFDNDYEDQISFRSGVAGDGIPEYINIDGSESHGWEMEAALQRPFKGFSAVGNYSLVDTRVVTNQSTSQQFQPGQPLLRRPKHSGTLRIAYSVRRVTVDFDTRWVGDRHDNSFLSLRTVPNAERPTAITTDITVNPGYTLMGMGMSVEAHRVLTLFVRADNLADTAWDSALGYPGLPRSAVAGVRFNVSAR
jgi:outer membrane cobalamin receptor